MQNRQVTINPMASSETSTPKTSHRIEAAGFAAAHALFSRLSLESGTNLAASGARVIGMASPLRKRADRNLALAMPEVSAQDRAIILKGMFDHLARNAIEYIHLREIGDTADRIAVQGEAHLRQAKTAGKGAVLVSAHLGNWEAVRLACERLDWKPALIYRAFNNPLIDAECRRLMSVIDAPILQKGKRGTLALLRHVKNGGAAMILTDQRFTGAPEIPFFGHPAKTALAAAEIAQKYNAPLIPVRGIRRDQSSMFDVTFDAPLEVTPGEEGAVAAMTEINRLLEQWIRQNPRQYFWLHNRWGKFR